MKAATAVLSLALATGAAAGEPTMESMAEFMAAAGGAGVRSGREEERIPCPPQTERTMVILALGQSNAANHGQTRTSSDRGAVAFFGGACSPARDPLPGGTGDGGSPWPWLGDALIGSGAADQVVFVPMAVNGASVGRWRPGGDLDGWLRAAAGAAGRFYRVTHVLWMQGETDLILGTDAETYKDGVRAVRAALREAGVDAPMYVSVSSGWCGPVVGRPPPPNPVSEAQRSLTAPSGGFLAGPDTDALVAGPGDRFDGCHMSAGGLAKLAEGWRRALER